MRSQAEILLDIAKIHQEWYDEMEPSVEPNLDDSDPHDKESGDSDYSIHYVDVSASEEQEQVFQDRVAELYKELQQIGSQ